MPVLVITTNQKLAQEIKAVLPFDIQGIYLQDVDQFQQWLGSKISNEQPGQAVLLGFNNLSEDLDQIHRLKALTVEKKIPVLVILQNINYREAALDAGADDYLLRPCDAREMAVRLRNADSSIHPSEEKIRFEETLKKARFTTVGRLVPGLIHDLNNQLQAVQGSMALALEELENPQGLTFFLQLGIEGTEKMSELINQMRLIYRPPAPPQPGIELNCLLQQINTMVGKELSYQKVHLKLVLNEPPLVLKDNSGDIQLVLLSVLFNLSDAIRTAGGGQLLLTSFHGDRNLELTLSTDQAIEPMDLDFEKQVLTACQGDINYSQAQQKVVINLPLIDQRKGAKGEA